MVKKEIEAKKTHPIRNFFIIILLLIIGVISWSRFISTKGLIVKEYAVINERIPESFHGFKIIQLSDLHYGRTINDSDIKKIVKTINSYQPDIVVFTGDLVDKDIIINEESIKNIIEYFKNIDPTIAKYSVKGNHDYETKGYDDIMEKAGFINLDTESKQIYYKGETPINIIGFPSSTMVNIDFAKPFEKYDENIYNIVLMHEPDNILSLNEYNVDLMLSGHSHGGQIRLPIIGAVVKNIGAQTYYDAYYKVDETDLYISSGLGTSTYNFRFMNKPSINLFRLYNN